MKPNHLAEILIVDDSAADRDLIRFAFENERVVNGLHEVSDGAEALAFLRREPPHQDAPRPDLILLDLNMPGMDGREFLERLAKEPPALRRIPVAVMTTSEEHSDVVRSYDLGANCYVTKPVDFDQLKAIADTMEIFWFGMVSLPP